VNSLAVDIRQLLARRIQVAQPSEILAIASGLCAQEILPALEPVELDARERFILSGENVVSDRQTGLSWSRDNVPGGRMTYAKAQTACAELDLDVRKDWRAPMPWELLTIVDYDRHSPAINPIFRCDSAGYWTAKPLSSSPADCAWIVGFLNGGSSDWDDQSNEYFVRAVRSSQ
jgi:Protein of unknown function (DUF1566)